MEPIILGRRVAREIRHAVIQHVCDHCPAIILPGESYVRTVTIAEGELVTEKFHAPSMIGGCLVDYDG